MVRDFDFLPAQRPSRPVPARPQNQTQTGAITRVKQNAPRVAKPSLFIDGVLPRTKVAPKQQTFSSHSSLVNYHPIRMPARSEGYNQASSPQRPKASLPENHQESIQDQLKPPKHKVTIFRKLFGKHKN